MLGEGKRGRQFAGGSPRKPLSWSGRAGATRDTGGVRACLRKTELFFSLEPTDVTLWSAPDVETLGPDLATNCSVVVS
jgi:hypothetical protein